MSDTKEWIFCPVVRAFYIDLLTGIEESSPKAWQTIGVLHLQEDGHVRVTVEDDIEDKWFENSDTACKWLRLIYARTWMCGAIKVGKYEIWRWGIGSKDLLLGQEADEDEISPWRTGGVALKVW